jgi:hypothetical protein
VIRKPFVYAFSSLNGKKRGRVCPICAERLRTPGIPVLLPGTVIVENSENFVTTM